MARRNLKYITFTKTERNRIADLISCGAMKGVEIVDGNEITIKTDGSVLPSGGTYSGDVHSGSWTSAPENVS